MKWFKKKEKQQTEVQMLWDYVQKQQKAITELERQLHNTERTLNGIIAPSESWSERGSTLSGINLIKLSGVLRGVCEYLGLEVSPPSNDGYTVRKKLRKKGETKE